ncbi:hypothetical protein FJZ40_03905 [Candidatus Shapirobacteria bacterium]|nr:hypothetical protein [Candidatus Shapirobacteria bacterium]
MYKIDVLLKQEQKLFHTNDLALLWKINKPNTLYTAIKRYVQKGVLLKIHKGFYATVPLEKIDPVALGLGHLHVYGYLSLESVLTRDGVIFQGGDYLTLVSSVSKKFTLAGQNYLVRKMKPEFLYQPAGLEERSGVRIATLERAVADLLYFQPHYHFDNPKIIDWQKVRKMQKEVGFR